MAVLMFVGMSAAGNRWSAVAEPRVPVTVAMATKSPAKVLAPFYRNGWHGWPVGTETRTTFLDDKVAGWYSYVQPDLVYRLTETALTRTQVVDGKPVVQQFDPANETGWQPAYLHKLPAAKATPTTIEIDGVKIDCLLYESTIEMIGRDVGGTTVLKEWVLAAHPSTWLRTEANQNYKVIQSLREMRQIGDRQVACVVVEERMEMSGGHQISTTWLSPEVPGHVVEKISQTWFEGRQQRTHERVAAMRLAPAFTGKSTTDRDVVGQTADRLGDQVRQADVTVQDPPANAGPAADATVQTPAVYAKVIYPIGKALAEKYPIEPWIKQRLTALGHAHFTAASGWTRVGQKGADNDFTCIWTGTLDWVDESQYTRLCPATAQIIDRAADGGLTVEINGFAPDGVVVQAKIPNELGSRSIVVVDKDKTAYVALHVGPPDQATTPQPAAAGRFQEELPKADLAFVGKVVKADLTETAWSGRLMFTRQVTYQVTKAIKGKPAENVVVDFIIVKTTDFYGPYQDGDNPRLNPKLFAAGSSHLVVVQKERDGDRQIVRFFDPQPERAAEMQLAPALTGKRTTDRDAVGKTVERLGERLRFLEQEMPTFKPLHHDDPPGISLTVTNDPSGLYNGFRKVSTHAGTNSVGQFNGMVSFFFNWTPSNKRELSKHVATDGWGMWVMLNVWQDIGLPVAADYEAAQRYIPWDGKTAWRGFKVSGTKWRMSIQVEGNQPKTIQRVHAVVDEELARLFERLK